MCFDRSITHSTLILLAKALCLLPTSLSLSFSFSLSSTDNSFITAFLIKERLEHGGSEHYNILLFIVQEHIPEHSIIKVFFGEGHRGILSSMALVIGAGRGLTGAGTGFLVP
ncbi:hypothetical protein F4861DRAFT_514819 [Xylaria intraflava]|nr:hypothetical protein F4861DRAFT_514819 [Xylaria intraflava]